jgi:capsular exopolysaccharide synthesis family protein
MGKVYDALQQAEERRARLRKEGSGAMPPPRTASEPAPGGIPGEAPAAPRSLWRRLLGRRGRRVDAEASGSLNKGRIALLHPDSYVAEQFRTLRSRIETLEASKPIRSIAVTSALPGEGKTLSAVNFALVSSMSVGRRVLLVDCDLRSPRVHRILGLRVDAGLAEVLEGGASPEEAVLRLEGTELDVIGVRSLPPNPSELVASAQMSAFVQWAVGHYDRVIFDAPPVIGLPEARTMSDLCDGTVFVVRADVTPEQEVRSALDVLDPSRVLGLLLNGVAENPSKYGYRY